MWYDEIECNRNKDTGNGLSTLNGQSEPFHSELKNSEWIKSPQVGFEPTTSQLTADRSTTELLRKNSLQEADSRSLDQPMTEQKRVRNFFSHTPGKKRYDSKQQAPPRLESLHPGQRGGGQPSTLEIHIDQLISASCQKQGTYLSS